MSTHSLYILLLIVVFFNPNLFAQPNCEEVYTALDNSSTLASFSAANGPSSFKEKVERSAISEELRGCENLQSRVWEDIKIEIDRHSDANQSNKDQTFLQRIFAIFKSKRKSKVSYNSDMKYAFLIATYGYTNQVDLQKIKDFVRSKPWEYGYKYAAHLAVDILLKEENDSQRDDVYHTYTLKEMKRARKLYAMD